MPHTFRHLDSTPPEGVTPPASVMTLEVTVENKPQELRKIRSSLSAVAQIPVFSMSPHALFVLQGLLVCFQQAGNVQEGLIGDILWGFAQCEVNPGDTLKGLQELSRLDYLKFQAKDNTFVDITDDKATSAWIRYQPKLLGLVYE